MLPSGRCICELWAQVGGWCHVVERDVVGHSLRQALGESSNLFMDVFHECVGGPSSLLLDGEGVCAIESHGHGSSSSQGVTAHILGCSRIDSSGVQ